MLLLLLCVSCILHLGGCQVRVDKVVQTWQDSDVTLQCRADTQEEVKQITWERKVNGNSVTFLTYRNDTGPRFPTSYGKRVRFRGDGNKDGSIQILNVSLTDEGVFKCVFTTYPSGTIEGEIQLQVFVLPSVKQELKQDVRTSCFNLVAECLASSAKPAAEIQWITHGINYTSKEEDMTHPDGTTTTRSQLYMMSTPELYGQEILCLVYQPKIPGEHQKNFTVNGTLTNIQFPPSKVRIEVLKNGDNALQLVCKSEANPRPKYTWKRVDSGESKVIPVDMAQETSGTLNFTGAYDDGLYICEATNSMGINQGYIYMYPTKGSSRQRFGLIISLSLMIFFVILIVSYIILSRLPKRREESSIMKEGIIQDHEKQRKERTKEHEESEVQVMEGSE
ncbi:nectin-3-like protein isoform 2-T2 [Leptodactylus fuscus]|uniref:nectin-3-like protein isoform X2 n=1 Tax=Leptodactylus fuscus TaxID=238119 RepID=UPI003F4E7561